MPPETLRVDPVLSYARRDGDAVRVVLVLPDADLGSGRARLRLRSKDDDRLVAVAATTTDDPAGRRVEAAVPREELGEGTWHLRLRTPGQGIRQLTARLLVRDGQPVALLPSFADAVVGT